jgi:hypothetical protein
MKLNLRYVPPILISLILIAAHISFGILKSYEAIALAIGASVATELILGRLYWGTWPNLASGYTSGISVAILVRSPMLWPFALCSVMSIMSKYVIRFKGRHIWNPSNFGLCALFFLAPFAVAPLNTQWGNNIWPMLIIWVIGLVTIWRVKRAHITLTYIAAFLVLAFVRSYFTGDSFLAEAAPITGPMYQLFALFMITDPKTTVSSKTGEVIVTVIIAVVELFLRLGEVVYAPFYALFIVGPIAMLIDIYWLDGDTAPAEAAEETEPVDAPEETASVAGAAA